MIVFREVEEHHLEQFKTWRNEFYHYFRQHKLLNNNQQIEWFDSLDDRNIMYSIYDGDELIGCAGLTHIDWINRQAELSFYIGVVYCDNRTYEIIDLLLKEAFNRYNMKRCFAEIYDFDPKCEYLLGSGMIKEACIKSTYYYDGKWNDSHIYSILDNEFREFKL